MRRKRNNIIKVAPIALLLALTSCVSSKKDDDEVSDMIKNANNYILEKEKKPVYILVL